MLADYVDSFIEHLKSGKSASELTLVSYRTDLKQFFTFLSLENQIDCDKIGNEQLNYQNVKRYLENMQRDGFSRATIARKLATIRSFVRFLCYSNVLPGNPIASVEIPKEDKPLPPVDPDDVDIILSAPNDSKASGMRDKAILELLYFSKLRISEIVNINVMDIELKRKSIKVRNKSDREKVISLGKRVQATLKKYLEHARPALTAGSDKQEEALFISKNGSRLTVRAIRGIINKYIERIASDRKMNVQSLRFSVAAQFISGGVDVKAVQEIFGLARVSVSLLYSQVDKERRLKQRTELLNRG